MKNTLGIEHRLHRKKILNCVHRLKLAEAQRDTRLNMMLTESGSMDPPVRKIITPAIEFLCICFGHLIYILLFLFFPITYLRLTFVTFLSFFSILFFFPPQFLSPEEEDPFLSNTLPGESKDIKRPGEDWRHMEGPKVPLSEVRTFKFHFFSTHISILFLIKFWY